MNAIIETIKTSRSICAYTERPAERELIAQALGRRPTPPAPATASGGAPPR